MRLLSFFGVYKVSLGRIIHRCGSIKVLKLSIRRRGERKHTGVYCWDFTHTGRIFLREVGRVNYQDGPLKLETRLYLRDPTYLVILS